MWPLATEDSGATAVPITTSTECEPPPAKKWKFLSAKQCASIRGRLLSTLLSVKLTSTWLSCATARQSPASDPLEFREQRMHMYPRLAPLAQDLIRAHF